MKTDAEKLQEIEDLFGFILRVQDKLAPDVTTASEAREGEGRKGVLMIRGDQKWTKIFEVTRGRLVPQGDLDNVRTIVIFEGVDVFRTVCSELLAGSTAAFSRARAKGDVKVVGDYAVRDGIVFNRLLTRVGEILSGYNVKFIGGE